MSLIIAIFGAIFAIFSVVVIHELGHFLVARAFGVKVLRFSIGFGKALWKYTARSGTEFVIALLPLGGYVRLFGEMNEPIPEEQKSQAYSHKPVLVRMAIVSAGPLINFLLAIVLYAFIFMQGTVRIIPVVQSVEPQSLAAQAGIKNQFQIKKVDDREVDDWREFIMSVALRMGDQGFVKITGAYPHSTETQYFLPLANWQIDTKTPDVLKSLGIKPAHPPILPIVDQVMKSSPAEKAGLLTEDKILKVDQQSVSDWEKVVNYVQAHPNKKINLLVEREGKNISIPLTVGAREEQGKLMGYIGVSPKITTVSNPYIKKTEYTFLSAWLPATKEVYELSRFNFLVLKNLILGKVSLRVLGGPITIFQTAGQASRVSWSVYLAFIAFISATLGFINLLPVPGLDGGHLFFQAIEGLAGKPLPQRIQLISLQIGIFLLLLLMVTATFNDVLRLF